MYEIFIFTIQTTGLFYFCHKIYFFRLWVKQTRIVLQMNYLFD